MRSAIVVPMTRAAGRSARSRGSTAARAGASTSSDVELAQELARALRDRDRQRAAVHASAPTSPGRSSRACCRVELPDIPGIEAAARFRPTGEGNEVGGDFYDVFETGDRGWTVVIGDVCGKGPDAAAVTALARYTLRAAAMRERLPSRSLRMLNEALLRQRDDRRFCTVAYAYLETLDGGARVGISHRRAPAAAAAARGRQRRAGGRARHAARRRARPGPRGPRRSRLTPGDALVFYTDGVIESRAGSDGVLDERRLGRAGRDLRRPRRRRDRREGRGGGRAARRAAGPRTTSPSWCSA